MWPESGRDITLIKEYDYWFGSVGFLYEIVFSKFCLREIVWVCVWLCVCVCVCVSVCMCMVWLGPWTFALIRQIQKQETLIIQGTINWASFSGQSNNIRKSSFCKKLHHFIYKNFYFLISKTHWLFTKTFTGGQSKKAN